MMNGRTPFFDKNRKLMFYRIINTEPSFPPTFSPASCDCIRGLLRVNEAERLGSGPTGAQEIMKTPFFATIDFKVSGPEVDRVWLLVAGQLHTRQC